MSPTPRTPRGTAREAILNTAVQLFYTGGVQAVGVDTIAERSGVAKVTLYRHFPTKDDLLRTVLERVGDAYLAAYRAAMDKAGDDPRARVAALFDALDGLAAGPAFRGCLFINTRLELGPAHPAASLVRRHKDALRDLLAAELARAGHRDGEQRAEQLLLLVDGALVEGALRPDRHPARAAAQLAQKVLD